MGLSYEEKERERLIAQIIEWNANRLDLFELSLPNENLEFYGVMRFFHQDEGSKVSTKCIRVSSTASTQDVLATLIEKFRPDMRMLTLGEYSLYEVHVNGEERKLEGHERPLYVQLNWGKDDREGRFLLKREDLKTVNLNTMMQTGALDVQQEEPQQFKRKLSKREKKELKKKEKEAKLKEQEKENVASKLYNEVPDTGFTRSISNPEAVMRRRRQQKLEKKLQQYKSKDGGPDTGGTLKIYGESINPDVPYKTLLLSITDTAAYVVKETLEKYGMEKEDPSNYMLVQAVIPPGGSEFHGGQGWPGQRDIILDDAECPLQILVQFPPSKGIIMFHIRRRPDTMPKKKKKKGGRGEVDDRGIPSYEGERMPFLVEVRNDLSEVPNGMRYTLPLNVTEVGSDKGIAVRGQHIQLYGNDIKPRHCLIAHTAGVVTVTPAKQDALTYVDGQLIHDTTMLQHGMTVKFGNKHLYRFIDPGFQERKMLQQPPSDRIPQGGPPPYDTNLDQSANFETTFDLDGHVETIAAQEGMMSPPYGNIPPQIDDILPATLEFREDGEDAFLAAVISEVNGGVVQFKLAPTYTIYMATRYRISMAYRPKMSPEERADRLTGLVNKVSSHVQQTIQENQENAVQLSFWMANASELLHFYKQDGDISRFSLDAQDILANAVQMAFRYLVNCLQSELHHTMVAFLNPSDFDINEDEDYGGYEHNRPNMKDIIQVLSSAMSLLRRCRVNAALTIQLFSQLFHFVNMWLFNRLVLEPELQLCTRAWGQRLRRRLSRIEAWAEKQGLELAADCHLARIIQAAHLLKEPKSSRDDITNISSTCFKLNSMQLRALLQNYIPGPGEPHIPRDLIENVVGVAQSTADELTRSDGREVMLPEEPDLHLPFLLPEDGYSCDIIRNVPNGLAEFLQPLSQTGICHMTVQPLSSGSWTIYMLNEDNIQTMQPPRQDGPPPGMPKEPQVINVTFDKVKGSMGLSIVAAKGEGQEKKGIYVKSVVPDGAAARDGRLQTGDQLLEVDGKSLIGVTQEKAAELMTRTGSVVTLKVAKQGAIYHGLATLLSQPSPVMQRAANNRKSGGAGGNKSPGPARSRSEESMQFGSQSPLDAPRSPLGKPPGPGGDYSPYNLNVQRPLQQQYGARSSPVLAAARSQEIPRGAGDTYKPPAVASPVYGGQEPAGQVRSKSTSNLDQPEKEVPGHHVSPQQGLRHASQPDLQHGYRYEDYPPPAPHSYQPNYVNQVELRNQPEMRNQGYWQNPDQPPYIKTSQSTPNVQSEFYDARKPPAEMDHSRVHEWQQRNELEQAKQQQRWQPEGLHREDDIPRGPPGQPQPQQGYYSAVRPRETTPPYDGRRQMAVPPKPSVAPKPGVPVKPKEVPKVQVDTRQPPYFEGQPAPKGAQYPPSPRGYPNNQQYPPTSQGHPVSSQYLPTSQYQQHPPSSQFAPTSQYMPQSADSRPVTGTAHDPYAPPKMLSPGGPHPYDRRNQSPELPPPPDMPPDLPPPPPPSGEELPPPPPPPAEYERQMQEEQMRRMNGDRMRMDPQGADSYRMPNQYRGPSPQYVPDLKQQKPGVPGPQQPGYPGYMPPSPQSNYHNYQNLPPVQNRSYDRPPSGQDQSYMAKADPGYYRPNGDAALREAPRQDLDTSKSMQKPRVLAPKPDFKKGSSPSPWEREHKEKLEKQREEEVRRVRQQQISELESKPYLTPEEQERLRRLRLDQEFEKRVAEAKDKEDEDSDTDMTDRPAGRAHMLRMLQDDLEKKRQVQAEEKQQHQLQRDQAEAEKQEKTERRLAMFERERQEQKEREMKRAERREKEQEDLLRKQRELRERQRQELEESQRQMRLEEERNKERQREELRKKKLAEQEHLRDLQLQREAEEQKMRQALGRPDDRYLGYQPDRMQPGPDRILPGPDRMAPGPMVPGSDRIPPGPDRMAPGPDRLGPGPDRLSSVPDRRDFPDRREHPAGPGYREPTPDRRDPPPGLPYAPREAPPGLPYAPREAPLSSLSSTSLHHYGPPPEASSAPQSYSGGPASNNGPLYAQAHRDSYPASGDPRFAPQPPERRSSYEVANQHGFRSSGHGTITSDGYSWDNGRGNSSALRQMDTSIQSAPGGAKKSVSFHDNIATEIHETVPYGSTSSDASYKITGSTSSGGFNTGSTSSYQSPFQRPNYGPSTPVRDEVFDVRTPENQHIPASATLVPGPTPGVVGAQEVYNDPRERIAAKKAAVGNTAQPNAERMSFRDKMKMFAAEAGENTPKDKPKISRAQRQIEDIINGQ